MSGTIRHAGRTIAIACSLLVAVAVAGPAIAAAATPGAPATPGCVRHGLLLHKKDCTAKKLFKKVRALTPANDPTTRKLRTAALGWVVGTTSDPAARNAAADVVELSLEYALGDPAAYRCQRTMLLRGIVKHRNDRQMIRIGMRVVKAAQSVSRTTTDPRKITKDLIWNFVQENNDPLAQMVHDIGNKVAIVHYMNDSLLCTIEHQ